MPPQLFVLCGNFGLENIGGQAQPHARLGDVTLARSPSQLQIREAVVGP
jgi:hypothetical protein